jgi:hypothetical protein
MRLTRTIPRHHTTCTQATLHEAAAEYQPEAMSFEAVRALQAAVDDCRSHGPSASSVGA